MPLLHHLWVFQTMIKSLIFSQEDRVKHSGCECLGLNCAHRAFMDTVTLLIVAFVESILQRNREIFDLCNYFVPVKKINDIFQWGHFPWHIE